MTSIILTADYGYAAYKASGLATGSLIDASAASWIHDNNKADGSSNPYPFAVYDSPGVVLDGGTIKGNIDLTTEWRTVYEYGNSAAIRTEDTPNVVIRDWRITDTWDAVRVSWNSPNFLIEDVWVTNARDDAVENDRLQTGTIRDCLFDGVFGGISIDPSSASPVDGHNNTVTLDGVLMRMKSFLYKGMMTHSSMIKTDSATDGEITPNLQFINCVFAIEDVAHRSYRSMFDAWANTIESRGNVFLNLSDKPLPADYPMPPAGWTILQGKSARDFWETAKTDWIKAHDDGAVVEPPPPPPPPPEEPPPPPPPEEPTTSEQQPFSGTSFRGTSGADTITGNALNNRIEGKSGADVISGGAGNDTIDAGDGGDTVSGGSGNDIFVFARGGDMDGSGNVDLYKDFVHGADKFDLRLIDASASLAADQAFAFIGEAAFGSGKPGQLRAVYDAAKDITAVQLNTDSDSGVEFFFHVTGRHAFTAGDFLL